VGVVECTATGLKMGLDLFVWKDVMEKTSMAVVLGQKKPVFIECICKFDDEKRASAAAATNCFDPLYDSFFVIPTFPFH
jgi:hypothetical protein